ncbi:MAG: NAD(P)/FAD-dependent oxidoreductase [bacterium]|nr:NAD(P)/FAD-dependent oxidoreductase [bacterium]
MKKIAIIGGGASGLIAACFAAGENKQVLLFEKQKKPGKKILITGNGRCNITNRNIDPSRYHGRNPRFVNNVFGQFGPEDTTRFFESIGLPLVELNDGKLFPASLQASVVPKLFLYELKKKNVDIHLEEKIDSIVPPSSPGKEFTLITGSGKKHPVHSVILAAGSCAYPQAGASKAGYDLAKSLGHKVYDPFPAILPITIPLKIIHTLQGIKWDCSVRAVHKKKTIARSSGELLFTAFGISGPAALDVSRAVNDTVTKGEPVEIIIDLFPGLSPDELNSRLDLLWYDSGKKLSFSLLGILKERMPEVLLSITGIDPERRVGSISGEEKKLIVSTLKGLALKPGKARSFDEAVVAAGGVDVNEVTPSTMESKIIKNLYITGELLDIDGDSGGFNLQFAWSTGVIAGREQ